MIPGGPSSYPSRPATDPDVSNSLNRFLGNQSLGTALAHNFAALQARSDGVDDPGLGKGKLHQQSVVPLPAKIPLVAAPVEPVAPGVHDAPVHRIQQFVVATNAEVLIVPPAA
jgi:hypothetical protein